MKPISQARHIGLALAVAAVAWGCDGSTPILMGSEDTDSGGTDTQSGKVDADSDGWPDDGDCDDGDPLTNPGSFELPENNRDDDCDGTTDENSYKDAGIPSGSPSLFGGIEDALRAPRIIYPAAEVLLPPNVSGIVFQWDGGQGNDLWRVTFDGEGADAVAYVTETRFTPQGALWETLTQGNLNRSVTITVEGTSALPASTKGTSASLRISFAEESIEGGLYYWAATSVNGSDYGIMRYDFGKPTQTAQSIYTASQAGRCVACHALSHDGTRMALNYDGGGGIADIVQVQTRTSIMPQGSAYYANFHSFSPDDQYLVSIYNGQMALRNGTNGALIEMAPIAPVTYPDWSPNGLDIAYTRMTAGGSDWSFLGGQIEVVQFHGPGSWSAPRVLVPAEPGVNYYYPAISPDGQWVVYNRSDGDTYSDDSAELWVISIAGGTPIRLDRLNADPGKRTSWAKWAPFAQKLGAEKVMWLTVSSTRPYAPELPGGGLPQIWMSAFHPERAAASQDPSRPGFWLPFQDLTTNNHIPQWTKVVVDVR